MPNGCSASVWMAPVWLTWSLDVSPRANWMASSPRTTYSTPRAAIPARPSGSRHDRAIAPPPPVVTPVVAVISAVYPAGVTVEPRSLVHVVGRWGMILP